MKRLSRTFFIGLILSMPLAVFAAAPQNVTGVNATLEGGRVTVSWNQVSDTDISFYRIFYSSESILNNGGVYDDFEFVDGSVNRHTLQANPAGPNVYVSVLAVNTNGEESPFFVEEAQVNLSGAAASAPSAPTPVAQASSVASVASSVPSITPPIAQPVTTETLRLLSAQAVSNTGILLTFNHTVMIPPAIAANVFTITTGSGKSLTAVRLVVQDKTVTIHTVMQERGVVYRLAVNPAIVGKDRNGTMIQFDDEGTPLLFSGHVTGKLPTQTPPSQPSSAPAQPTTGSEVASLHLRAVPEGTLYTVEATWQPRDINTVAGYLISQTTDKGTTFAAPQPVAKESTGVNIPRIPAGEFGLKVQTVSSTGELSNGVTQLVSLPAIPGNAPIQGSVTPPTKPTTTPKPSNMPSTGLGISTVMAMTGALAGWRKMRKLSPTVA